jgi:hypothetical protein
MEGDELGRWTVLQAIARFEKASVAEMEQAIGAFALVAHSAEAGAQGAWTFATVAARSPVTVRKSASDEARSTIVYALKKRSSRFPGTILAGRAASNDVFIESQEVSKLHARIRIGERAIHVEDAGSTNGTFVEGERIRKEATVQPGETIGLGGYALTVYTTASLAEHLRRLARQLR